MAKNKRLPEVLLTLVIFIFSTSLALWGLSRDPQDIAGKIVVQFAFAAFVALMVRWLYIAFTEIEAKKDIYGSSIEEYHNAIQRATGRIWISQTWLPGIDRDAEEIVQVEQIQVQIMLASFKPKSPIYARIAGRNISEDRAKENINGSLAPFIREESEGKRNFTNAIKFCFGHHPGWIAIVDSEVFWGPTPIHLDNQSQAIFFHKDSVIGKKGSFWYTQFSRQWEHFSHDYDEERINYNNKLPSRKVG